MPFARYFCIFINVGLGEEPVIIVWMNSPCLFELQMELSLPDAIN